MKIVNKQTKTRPIVIHAPGFTASKARYGHLKIYYQKHHLWAIIRKSYKKCKPKCIMPGDMDNLTIITWNNGEEKGILEECLGRMNAPFLVLGKGIKKWKNITKIHLTCEALNNISTKYVMGLDSYDVLLLENPREAVKRFESLFCEMLFNASFKFYPSCHRFEQPGECFITRDWEEFQGKLSDSPWKYLNAGAWIGKTSFCRKFFADCLSRKTEELVNAEKLPFQKGAFYQKLADSEQVIFHTVFRDYFPQVRLDHNCEIFLNLSCLPDPGKYVRLYRKLREIPLSEWISMPIMPVIIMFNWFAEISRGEASILDPLYRLSKILKEKFVWYRRFIIFIKGGI